MPPRQGEPHTKVFNGKTLHWCGKPACRKWTDHKTSEHIDPPPAGNLADDTPPPASETEGDTVPDDVSAGTNPQASLASDKASLYHFGAAV